MSFDPSDSRSSRGLLASTVVIALVTGVCALGLVHRLAQTVEKPGSRMASLPPGLADPEVTGSIGNSSLGKSSTNKLSIGGAARTIVLDPCTGNERLVVRGP